MKKELSYILRTMLSLIAVYVAIQTYNKVTAAPEEHITVAEELGIYPEKEVIYLDCFKPVVAERYVIEGPEVANEDEIEEELLPDIELIARAVEAEAENQNLMGKRLVAAVILNRLGSDRFPDDVKSVIYQKNQFSVVSSGRINRVTPSEDSIKAAKLEIEDRSDSDILFFSAGGYNKYCKPGYKYGDHYFGY